MVVVFISEDIETLKAQLNDKETKLKNQADELNHLTNKVIPDLKKQHPEFSVMVGSNLDHPSVIRNMKRIHPQLLSISELIAYPVDGFVSMLSFSDQTIRTLCDDYLLIPSAYTPNEAFHQLTEGAHFLKLSGKNIGLIKTCRAAPTFGCMPLFVTGGVNTENMQEIYAAGAMVTASGFDVILKGISPEDASVDLVAERISCFVNTAKQARADKYPSLANTASLCDSYWLNLLPHYHPFS